MRITNGMTTVWLWVILWGLNSCVMASDIDTAQNEDPTDTTDTDGNRNTEIDTDTENGIDSLPEEEIERGFGLHPIWAVVHDDLRQFEIWAADADAQGNVVIAGNSETPDLDDDIPWDPSPGLFVAKYDSNGERRWIREYDAEYARIRTLAIGADGTILLIGEFSGTINFGETTLRHIPPRYYFDTAMFIVRMSPDGTILNSRVAGGEHRIGIAKPVIRQDGHIIVAGDVSGIWEMDHRWVFSFDRPSPVILHFNADLILNDVWHYPTMGAGMQSGGLAISDEGDILIGGSGFGPLNLDGTPQSGSTDTFLVVVRLDPHGTILWHRRFDAGGMPPIRDMKMGRHGDIFLMGGYSGFLDFGGGRIDASNSLHESTFIAKLNNDGEHQWSRGFDWNPTFHVAESLVLDTEDRILVTGSYSGNVDCGGIPVQSASGGRDALVAQFNRDGALLWCQGFGFGPNWTYSKGVWMPDDLNVLTVGHFSRKLTIGDLLLQDNAITGAGYIALFSIDDQAQSSPHPFTPNPGDLTPTMFEGTYIPTSLASDSPLCDTTPLDGWSYCLGSNRLRRIAPGVSATITDICTADASPVISNEAAAVTLTENPTEWGTAQIRASVVSPQLSSALWSRPEITVVDSSYNRFISGVPLETTTVGNDVVAVVHGVDGFRCEYEYKVAIRVRLSIECPQGIVSVDAYSTHTWCLVDDTCTRYGWVAGGGVCHEVFHLHPD